MGFFVNSMRIALWKDISQIEPSKMPELETKDWLGELIR